MRKRDHLKSITPFIFIMLWLYIFDKLGVSGEGEYILPVVGSFVLLVSGSIFVTDAMIDFFDKNDNEENE